MMENVLICVKLTPRARHDRIRLSPDGSILAAVTSPPVDGRANEHLVRFLAECIGVSRSRIAVLKGLGSRNKTLGIYGLSKRDIINRLAALK